MYPNIINMVISDRPSYQEKTDQNNNEKRKIEITLKRNLHVNYKGHLTYYESKKRLWVLVLPSKQTFICLPGQERDMDTHIGEHVVNIK